MSLVTAKRRSSRPSLETLVERVGAVRRFVDLAQRHVPAGRLDRARAVVGRAGERLALSRAHTVVVLAGATGSGKSSIFNALAGEDLSPVGVRRPTTGEAHACVWGPDRAHELLDWLAVTRRFGRADEAGLTGLVLVDLPDFDSVERSHRIEADRLLELADLIVWVLDPQKYADRVLHRRYLAGFGHHRDITVVALNQADRLTDAELQACLTDLRGLLKADGLEGAPVLAASIAGRPGLDQLRRVLEQTVAARLAALQRLSADVAATVDDLEPLVSAAGSEREDRAIASDLYESLGVAAGVPLVGRATERSYVHRAVAHTGWPVTRWVRRFRPDPLGRLRLGGRAPARGPDEPIGATSIGPSAPAAEAAVSLALRAVGDRSAAGLPDPWPAAMLGAARSRADDIADALDLAVARTDLGMSRIRVWWRLVGLLQWLFVIAAGLGLVWLVLRYALFALALPEPPAPEVGRLPLFTVLFVGGLVAGLVLAVVIRPIVSAAARRRRRQVTTRLHAAVRRVADDLVLAPVAAARREYADARKALQEARGDRA
jgi:GTP-binding protein EngB required for normal cell division